MYTVYAIKSTSRNYIYVGLTNNLERRLFDHNSRYNKTTKPYVSRENRLFEDGTSTPSAK